MSEGIEGATKGLGIFSTLETATDMPFFLLATSFALAVDSTVAHFHQNGLFRIAANPALMQPSLGLEVILVFIGFSFLTSTALPIAAVFFEGLIGPLIFWVVDCFAEFGRLIYGDATRPSQRRHNHVSAYELSQAAHDSKDSYLLSLLAKHDDEVRRDRRLMFRTAFYGFCALVMAIVNYFVVDDSKNGTLLGTLAEFCGTSLPVWAALVGLFIAAYSRYWKNERWAEIFCPTLYREIKQKNEEKKKIFNSSD